jgi:hypothetical protein
MIETVEFIETNGQFERLKTPFSDSQETGFGGRAV